jgi:hypothetical protein
LNSKEGWPIQADRDIIIDEEETRHDAPDQEPTPFENLPRLRSPLHLAEEVGARLGTGQILQRSLPEIPENSLTIF